LVFSGADQIAEFLLETKAPVPGFPIEVENGKSKYEIVETKAPVPVSPSPVLLWKLKMGSPNMR